VPLRDAIELMTVMRDTWQELFQQQGDAAGSTKPSYNAHGSALLNAQG